MNPHALSEKLTRQFYEWEMRGRGWHKFQQPVQLEPAFKPFFGHFVSEGIVDDGRRPRWWDRKTETILVKETESVVDAYPSEEQEEFIVYSVSQKRQFSASPSGFEQFLTILSSAVITCSFEMIATAQKIVIQFTCRRSNAFWLHAQLSGFLPDCSVRETGDDALLRSVNEANSLYATDFGMSEEFMRPIAVHSAGRADPLLPLVNIANQLLDGEGFAMQVLFCGAANAWAKSITKSVTDSVGGSFFIDASEMPALATEKVSQPLVGATVRLLAFADKSEHALRLIEHCELAIQQTTRSPHNNLMPLDDGGYDIGTRVEDILLRRTHRLGMLLNVKELATLVHVPNPTLSKKLISSARNTKAASGFNFNPDYVLGNNEYHGNNTLVGLDIAQRTRHIQILGNSGTGKSTLLHSLISQDIKNGIGCCVLDPHGDLIEQVLDSIPDQRVDDVVLIDPSDSDYPVGLNILSAHSDIERELLASDLVALFKRFSTSWGDNLHSVLANAIMAFLYNSKPGHLGDLRRFLIEPAFRTQTLITCTDEELKYYWQTEYPLLRSSSIGSILTRLDSFLRPKAIRNMIRQHRSLDFGALMNESKIILIKLSQGLMGAENSYLLGACIVAKLQQSAMARQQQAASERVPFFCYIDEFHHFVTESMSTILTGLRKFNFGLVLAHQHMQHIQNADSSVASAITGVGTRVCFGLSDTDAKRMQEGFSYFTADDLQNLDVGQAIMRVNTADNDFNISVMPMAEEYNNKQEIIETSRLKYSVPISPPPTPASPFEPDGLAEAAKTITPVIQPTDQKPITEEQPKSKTVQEHRYLQSLIKTLGEQHGYKANIELPTKDGKGQIDVVLEKESERIAFEVSVSTTAEWELHNIQKCLADDFTRVVACSSSERKLTSIKEKIKSLPASEQAKVLCLSPNQLSSLFTSVTAPQESVSSMKGYRVKVQYNGTANIMAGEIIGRIVSQRK